MYNKFLDTFKVVADQKSFTKAANQLFISHTAVIKQINSLENHLGVQLFIRSNQGVTLTNAGQCLYKNTLEIIRFSENAIREIQAANLTSPQIIRVGTSLFYPCHIFVDFWNTLSYNYPQYKLQIVTIENDELYIEQLNNNYDILIAPFNQNTNHNSYNFFPLGSYQFCLSMPRNHVLAKKKQLSFKDLAGEKLLMMQSGKSDINDQIRQELKTKYPKITIQDISYQYSMKTFNLCIENNALLLSLECWANVHPGIISIPLCEDYSIPYGILVSKNLNIDLSGFAKFKVPNPLSN